MDGYSFDPAGIHRVRQAWNDIVTGLEADSAEARTLAAVTAPGHEPASGRVATTQNSSGEELAKSITAMLAFARSYADSLGQAGHGYRAREDATGSALTSGGALT